MGTELDGTDSSSSDKEEKVGKSELKHIERVIKSSINVPTRTKKTPNTMKQKIQRHKVLHNILSEHLSAYLIVGFDINEEEFYFIKSSSPLETRALTDLIDDSVAALYEKGILRGGGTMLDDPHDLDADDDDDE